MRSLSLRALAAALLFSFSGSVAVQADPSLVRSNPEAQKRLNEILQERGLPALTESAYAGDPAAFSWVGLALGARPASGLIEPGDLRNALTEAEAARHPRDDASVAAARGLTIEQLRAIREQRSLTNEQILTLNTPRLRRFVQRLTKPKAAPDDYFRYRNSFLVDESGTIPEGAMERAFEQARKMPLNPRVLPAARDPQRSFAGGPGTDLIASNSWTWRGPGNIGGRIRAMLIDPADRNKLWIGSAGGGIWKSTNAGASWSPVDDFMPNLAVCALLYDPTNAQTMYAGTGEISPNLDAIRGVGIFKSTDGGTTWSKLANTGTGDFYYVSRLAATTTGTTLLAGTRAGILRSTDSGETWTKVYTSGLYGISHVAFHPTDNTKAIASGYNGQLRYSTDGGATWLTPTGTLPNGGGYSRTECAYARSNPAIVYAIAEGQTSTPTRFFKSTNGGATFAEVAITGSPDIAAGQGWYDLLLWVDPLNANRVIAGGVDLWRSTDGGVNFTNITNVYTGGNQHPDQHLVVSDPGYNGTTNKRGYILNDGGVARTEDLTAVLSTTTGTNAWTKLNNNLGITQFYGGSGDPTTGMLIGGTQDNGTLRLANSSAGTGAWSLVIGGDGGYAAVDQADTRFVYGETQNLGLRRSSNGGTSFSLFTGGITGSTEFIAPFVLDPNSPTILHFGGQGLFTSFDARSGAAFFQLKPSVGSNISAIGVAPGNSNLVYVGHVNGGVYKTTNALNGGVATWTQVGSGTLPARRVTRFAVDRNDNNRVFVSYGGFLGGEFGTVRAASNLWKSVNGGTSWTNSHGNLPLAPIYCVLIDPGNSNIVYVGTDAGIYASTDGGTTWTGTNLGPATAPVVELFVQGTNLVAVTHGRGMFTAPAFDTTPPTVVITPDSTPTNASPVNFRFRFSEVVTGFSAGSVTVTNGTAGTLSGSGSSYLLPVTPDGNGPVGVTLAAAAVQDLNGNANAAAASASAVDFDVASPFLFATAFDGASAPVGWTANAGWSYGVSATGTGRPNGDHTGAGGKLFATSLSGNYANGANTYLTTPVFDLPAGRSYKLRFYMWLRAESGQDGGNLEISANGGAFTLVPGAQLSVPYNGTIAALSGTPAGWTGTTLGAWRRVRLDLTAYAGQSVQFRFHFGSGASVNEAGWFIDDFAIEQTPVLTLSPSVQAVAEGSAAVVNIDVAPKAPETFNAAVGGGGTAVSGTDYGAVAGTQSVSAGAAQKAISVAPIQDGTQAPRRQTVILTLAGGTDYTVGTANTATVVLLGDGGYDQWRLANFTPAQLAAQPGVTGVNDTPANDGVSNLLKFALGLAPFTPSAALVPVSEVVNISGQDFVQIRFVRPSPLVNASYVGEVSGDLVAWSSNAADVETIVSSGPGPNQQTVIYRDRTAIAAPLHRFLRLRVTSP